MATEEQTRRRTRDELMRAIASPVIDPYDYQELSYTDGQLTQIVYKQGGSGGTTIATVAYGYTNGQLTSITKT